LGGEGTCNSNVDIENKTWDLDIEDKGQLEPWTHTSQVGTRNLEMEDKGLEPWTYSS